ncbi:MAG: hypothetical protein ACM3WV_12355 [Bacillota bacterium]
MSRILTCLCLLIAFYAAIFAQSNDFQAFLPKDAKILEYAWDKGFDTDSTLEICAVYEFYEQHFLAVLDLNAGKFIPYYLKNLGAPLKSTGGKVESPYQGYTYQRLYLKDINYDGLIDVIVLFQPADSRQKEIQIIMNNGKTLVPWLKLSSNYDFRMYQLKDSPYNYYIDSVNLITEGEQNYCIIQKWCWDFTSGQWQTPDNDFTLSEKDYLEFSRLRQDITSRKSGDENTNPTAPLFVYSEIPIDDTAMKSLLPAGSKIVQKEITPAFDNDMDPEIMIIYAIPGGKPILKGLLLDWDFNKKEFHAEELPYRSYGYPANPENYLYRPVYLFDKKFHIHSWASLSNIMPDNRYLSLDLFAADGMSFRRIKKFQANYNLHLFLYERNSVELWEIITVFKADSNNYLLRKYHLKTGAGGLINAPEPRIASSQTIDFKNYRKNYYRLEGSYYLSHVKFHNILSTVHPEMNPYADPLPQPEFPGTLEDYILHFLNTLQIKKWVVRDINQDRKVEGILLLRRETSRESLNDLAVIKSGLEGKKEYYIITDAPFDLEEHLPGSPAGVYLYDLNLDNVSEILLCKKSSNANSPGYKLTVFGLVADRFYPVFSQIPYSSVFLYETKSREIKLIGGVRESGSWQIYTFLWKDNGFGLIKTEKADSFIKYVDKIDDVKIKVFTDKYKLFLDTHSSPKEF